MSGFLKDVLMRKALAGAACAAIAVAFSACTDYVAQMEADFEAWAALQGDEIPLTTPGSSTSTPTVSVTTGSMLDERDGQIYKTVLIGKQVWMAQNLNYASDFFMSYCYNDLPSNCDKYGRLYTWATAMDSIGAFSTNGKGCGTKKYGESNCSPIYPVQGICPSGWHLPDSTEFQTLFDYVGGDLDNGMKLRSSSGWNNNRNGSDAYGFSALPAGGRMLNGEYADLGEDASFWSSSLSSGFSNYGDYLMLYDGNGGTRAYGGVGGRIMEYGHSVRCIQN